MATQPARFSQASLWQRQRQYFEHMGIEAWRQEIIPQYITTNPFLARVYSDMVLGFLRDATLHKDAPVYIVEWGAGTGRFAFHFLRKFLPLLKLSPFSELDIRYVLTDFVPKTLEEWRMNPTLSELMVQGVLDYAYLDLEAPQALTLLHSGQILDPATLSNPLILIANYVFDSIPQDLFWVEAGELEEYQVEVEWVEVVEAKDWIAGAMLDFSTVPIPVGVNYYALPELNTILQDYQATLHQTVLAFPHRALEALHFFCGTSSRQARLVLCGDKGFSHAEDLAQRLIPSLASHGSFSMPVNFDAIQRYVELRHGHVLQPEQRHTNLHVVALLWGEHTQETRLAFYQAMNRGGPDEFFLLKCALEKHYDEFTFDQLLAWLRWAGWDSKIFMGSFERLVALIPEATPNQLTELQSAVEKIWQHYLALHEDEDVASCLGRLLFSMGLYEQALNYFQYAIDQYGMTSHVLYNMGICAYELGNPAQAIEYLQRAVKIEADFAPAHEMLHHLANQT